MFKENVKLAFTSLAANKLRTLLTMLGIMIGIASVIAIMTVGDGLNRQVYESINSMGANTMSIYVTPKNQGGYGEQGKFRDMKDSDYMTPEVLEDLLRHFEGRIAGIALTCPVGESKITDGKKYANINLSGVNSTAFLQNSVEMVAGRTMTSLEYRDGKRVAIVSDKFVNNLFDGDPESAVGQTMDVLIGNQYTSYTIVGVYHAVITSYTSGVSEQDMSTSAYVPLKAAVKQKRQTERYDGIEIIAQSGEQPDMLSLAIQDYLNETYYGENDAYETVAFSMQQQLKESKSLTDMMRLAFTAISAISLLVGGIGVMNIMIVSITERTREIGTRKALGATNAWIRLQFITEAVVVCLIGGMIGVVFGILLGFAVCNRMHFPCTVSLTNILICVLFAMALGIFFGFYPANRAAKLNPIEALRYE